MKAVWEKAATDVARDRQGRRERFGLADDTGVAYGIHDANNLLLGTLGAISVLDVQRPPRPATPESLVVPSRRATEV